MCWNFLKVQILFWMLGAPDAAGHDEKVPDGVAVADAAVQVEESAAGVGQAAGQKQGEGGRLEGAVNGSSVGNDSSVQCGRFRAIAGRH